MQQVAIAAAVCMSLSIIHPAQHTQNSQTAYREEKSGSRGKSYHFDTLSLEKHSEWLVSYVRIVSYVLTRRSSLTECTVYCCILPTICTHLIITISHRSLQNHKLSSCCHRIYSSQSQARNTFPISAQDNTLEKKAGLLYLSLFTLHKIELSRRSAEKFTANGYNWNMVR